MSDRVSTRSRYVVPVAELAELITAGRPPVLLDVQSSDELASGSGAYAAGHIPGAVPVDLPTHLQSPSAGTAGKRPLPDVATLQKHTRSWGINVGDPVVVYDHASGALAGRAHWVLRWAGLTDVRLLDGGYRAWVAAGEPVSTEQPTPTYGNVTLRGGHLPVLDADEAASYAAQGRLFDARRGDAYGAGHIPGAVSAPTRNNLDEQGLLLDDESLRRRFVDLGIDGSQPVGLYCGGGVAAAHQATVLHALGIDAALFVGSFSAWSADPGRPVATGA